jgi:hypothetical protein
MPKAVTPVAARACSAAEVQAINRFGGWAFVIAGLVMAAAWILLPRGQATPVSLAACGGAVLLLAVRVASAKRA